jgi:hypothetical protein
MICRKSYISPVLFHLFDTGRLGALWHGEDAGRARSREQRLGAVLAATT